MIEPVPVLLAGRGGAEELAGRRLPERDTMKR